MRDDVLEWSTSALRGRSPTHNNNNNENPPAPPEKKCGASPAHMPTNNTRRIDSELEDALAGVALLSFRCPLSREAQLRVRLPRRYPEEKLQATVEGTPRLSAVSRRKIAVAANAAAVGVGGGGEGSGERRCEPQCLQVLSEAMQTSDDLDKAERESVGGTRVSSSLAAGESTAGGGSRVSATRGIDGRDGEEESGGTLRGARRKKDSKASGTLEQQHQHEHKQQQHQNQQQRQQRSARAPDAGEEREEMAAVLGRRLIYSHHIIASQKRTGVVKAARELGLGGFSKVSGLVVEWPSDRGPLDACYGPSEVGACYVFRGFSLAELCTCPPIFFPLHVKVRTRNRMNTPMACYEGPLLLAG